MIKHHDKKQLMGKTEFIVDLRFQMDESITAGGHGSKQIRQQEQETEIHIFNLRHTGSGNG